MTAALERHLGDLANSVDLLRASLLESEGQGLQLQSLGLLLALSHLGKSVDLLPSEQGRLDELVEALGVDVVDVLAFPEKL